MGLPARCRDLWILAAVLASEKKLIKKSTHSVWISVFAAAVASASAGTHSVNESLANLDESLYAVIDFQPQPLEKNKKQFLLLFCCRHNLPAAVFVGCTCPPRSLLPGLLL